MTPLDPAAPPPVRFRELADAAMAALLEGDSGLARASAASGVTLTGHFTTEEARRLWRMCSGQLAADPASRRWIARSLVTDSQGLVVGHTGFHGPPDSAGVVEVGYYVVPERRRRGYARAILAEQLRRTSADPAVRTVRVTITPDNAASLATIAGFGFTATGELQDEDHGRMLIFERPTDRLCAEVDNNGPRNVRGRLEAQ